MKVITIHRKSHFNAAHRLFVPDWSDEKNFEVFGKCSNPHYHGHNYELVVSLSGTIDPVTGFVFSIGVLKNIIKEHVEEVLDHKNINLQIPYFKNLNPTAENIAIFIWKILRKKIPRRLDLEITLYETPRNYVTYKG